MNKISGVLFSMMLVTMVCSAEANPFADTTISVSKSKTEPASTKTAAVETKAKAETKAESTKAKSFEYTVQTGDYLYSIAKKFYGDGSRYNDIIEANKDKYPSLLTNPALIYTGWTLTIPNVSGNAATTVAKTNTTSATTSKPAAATKPTTNVTTTNSAPVSTSTPGSVTISANKIDMNVPKQCQFKSNVPGPGSACGPTSLSMILSYYGKGNTDTLVTNLYNICGTRSPGGTDHEGLLRGAKQYGFANTYWKWGCTQDWCRQQLAAGKPLLCHVKNHYVCLRGMDSNGNVIVNDPAREEVTRTMSWSEFVSWWQQSGLGCSAMVVQ